MTQRSNRPKLGVLALTLELYETLAPALRASRQQWLAAKALPPLRRHAEVLFPGAVYTREAIEDAVDGFVRERADAIVVVLLTYSPSQLALPALKRCGLPILVWNTQELWAVGPGFTSADMVDNHGVHGTQDLCNVLARAGVPFEYVTSHLDDPQGTDGVRDFLRAAWAVGRLRRARLGLLGYPFPGMGDFALDTTHMAATLGCQTLNLGLEDYIDLAEQADQAGVAALIDEYRREYRVADDIEAADLEATARVELALAAMVERDRLDGLSYQFMVFGQDRRTPTVPFVAASRLMARGVGFGGEGDLIAAAGSVLLNWLAPPASFAEMFTIDFGGHAVFMSHMGEANVAMARPDRKIRMVARASPITRTRHGQLELVTAFRPGPATLCALTLGRGGTWRLIASAMDIQDFGPLEMAVPHFKLAPRSDVRDFLTAYAKAGGPHHLAVCFGDARRNIRYAAAMLGAEYHEV